MIVVPGEPFVVVLGRFVLRTKVKQIPFGNDRKKSEGKNKSRGKRRSFDFAPVGRYAQDDDFLLVRQACHCSRVISHVSEGWWPEM